MLNDPNILILDEPAIGLDHNQIIEFGDPIKSFARGGTIRRSRYFFVGKRAIRYIQIFLGRTQFIKKAM